MYAATGPLSPGELSSLAPTWFAIHLGVCSSAVRVRYSWHDDHLQHFLRAIFVPTRPACSLESPAAYHCGPREHSPPASSSTSVLVFPKWIVITGSLDWAKGSSANDLLEGHLRCVRAIAFGSCHRRFDSGRLSAREFILYVGLGAVAYGLGPVYILTCP